MRRRQGKRAKAYGTPTGAPRPQGVDDWTGFKVDHDDLKLEWDGLRTVDPDRRNPQDFVKGVKDNQNLPWARPEAPDVFLAENLRAEDGQFLFAENGEALYTEGIVVTLGSI